ncbi:hypothetical protein [Rugamonas apoptosis]|uniref:Uncharacterized protein n=1 Tax=Rugamonas apoptosis TaxID=2758570 RepID=A0A7W2ILZ0_9BURK|nr:hypothetical protein [Rugamonas apoptosis]MBA5689163.1 hypothetical protein [Rugamonas apoptosis]
MDRSAFRQIKLSTRDKVHTVVAWMRFIQSEQLPVPRDAAFELRFIQETHEAVIVRLRDTDTWLQEHVARLFWTCVDMGLLEYQYPYPHTGQSYSPTRLGRIVIALPRPLASGLVRTLLMFESLAGPIKNFSKIRNAAALLTALVGWYSNPQVQAITLAIVSAVVAIVSTWLAQFLTTVDD